MNCRTLRWCRRIVCLDMWELTLTHTGTQVATGGSISKGVGKEEACHLLHHCCWVAGGPRHQLSLSRTLVRAPRKPTTPPEVSMRRTTDVFAFSHFQPGLFSSEFLNVVTNPTYFYIFSFSSHEPFILTLYSFFYIFSLLSC